MSNMIRTAATAVTLAVMAAALLACQLSGAPGQDTPTESSTDYSSHLIAEARLTSLFIEAALNAGYSAGEINAILAEVAGQTVIDEFWISDHDGNIAFTSHPGTDFTFPTDPNAGTQAAPFAKLLDGSGSQVVQEPMPREFDGRTFQYAAVAGVDSVRIVQVGIEAEDRPTP